MDLDDSLKKDKEIVETAARVSYIYLKHADESLKKDPAFMLKLMKIDSHVIEYAHESLRKNKKFMLAAVQNSALALLYVDESLKKDKQIAEAAIKQNELALLYVDESLWPKTGVLTITDSNFQSEVLDVQDKPVVIIFWAPTTGDSICSECKKQLKTMDELTGKAGNTIVFGRVNTEENKSLSTDINNKVLPVVRVYKNGKLVTEERADNRPQDGFLYTLKKQLSNK